jgi:photosystem II PsbU protein
MGRFALKNDHHFCEDFMIQRLWKSFLLGLCLVTLMWIGLPLATPALAIPTDEVRLCADTGQKLDLNNANLKAFTDCPGFYPNLASAIVTHGPYDKVEDVLAIPDLTDQQKALLQANLDAFTANPPVVPLVKRMPPRLTLPAH